jgi:hypothetical protein
MTGVDMLIEIENILADAYTVEGQVQWWSRPRTKLDGRTPNEAWVAGDYEAVYNLALSLDASNGT